MSSFTLKLITVVFLFISCTQSPKFTESTKVEASCGQCQFGLKGHGCDLAVRIKGEAYYVDGTSIDEHGDAHAHDGFCNAVKHAYVTGEVKNGRFVATSFEVID